MYLQQIEAIVNCSNLNQTGFFDSFLVREQVSSISFYNPRPSPGHPWGFGLVLHHQFLTGKKTMIYGHTHRYGHQTIWHDLKPLRLSCTFIFPQWLSYIPCLTQYSSEYFHRVAGYSSHAFFLIPTLTTTCVSGGVPTADACPSAPARRRKCASRRNYQCWAGPRFYDENDLEHIPSGIPNTGWDDDFDIKKDHDGEYDIS